VSRFVCCYAECRYAERRSCRNTEGHYAVCHYAECRNCRNAECRYAGCHYDECHYAEYRNAECLFPMLYNFFKQLLSNFRYKLGCLTMAGTSCRV
jgi:hypothetical protein